jgi:hypothetical protein
MTTHCGFDCECPTRLYHDVAAVVNMLWVAADVPYRDRCIAALAMLKGALEDDDQRRADDDGWSIDGGYLNPESPAERLRREYDPVPGSDDL